jgi:GxxExxY protein
MDNTSKGEQHGPRAQVRIGANAATCAWRLGHAYADGYAERLNRKGREGRKGTPVHTEEISRLVVDSALKVHSALGPGLLESAYRACLAHESEMRGLDVSQEKPLPIRYEGADISVGYRIDLLLNQKVIVKLKAVERLLPIHTGQVLSYLKLSGCKLGFLINFNVLHLKDGIKRVVNGL